MLIDILAGSLNILGWGIKPLFEKQGIKHSSVVTFANLRYIFTAIICLVMLISFKGPGIFNDLNSETIIYSGIVSVLGIGAILANYYLLSKYDANYVIGIVEPSVIIITLLCGYCFFEEKVNLQRIIGIIIVCIGIYTIFTSNY